MSTDTTALRKAPAEIAEVWSAAVQRASESQDKASAVEWTPCELEGLEIEDHRWWRGDVTGGAPLRVWVGISRTTQELGSLAASLSETPGEDAGATNEVAEAAIRRMLEELVSGLQKDQGNPLSLESFEETERQPPPSAGFSARRAVEFPTVVAAFEQDDPGSPSISQAAPETVVHDRASFGQLLNIDLPLRVRVGSARLPIEDVLQLKAGAMIELDRAHEDVVDLMVNGAVVARADLVAIDGSCGLKIREVVGTEGRIEIQSRQRS